MKNTRYPEPQDKVEIITPIGKEFQNDMIGTVLERDGEYVLVKLDKSNVVVERYPCELIIL